MIEPLEMTRRDNAAFEVQLLNPKTQQPVPISGIVRFTGRREYSEGSDDSTAVFSIVSPGDITVTDAPNGKALITMPESATEALENKRTELYVDIQHTSSTGKTQTVYRNKLIVKPEASLT